MQADTDTRALRLLVVEDEAIIAMLVEDALTMAGHVVVGVAESAGEALDLAAREPIDLALCDVRLAENDSGIAVARALSARGIPCLYVSGNCPTEADHPLIVGCVGKPFATAALSRAVEAAYRIAQGEREVAVPKSMHLFARD
ncbi:response regulator [Sphingomonas sp. BK235]|jgi:two-component system, response regulator PdtaR|uniref:response regulator n=1 Tax=Sphingomonas sp. BK235 TaxID=2512131 RepID=UPI00104F566D|nr:response regulator [Sphingomonas sp. BK235]TCP36024.1 response regulator receiver domain-containing protein [Sphingomonas sp. BK235]